MILRAPIVRSVVLFQISTRLSDMLPLQTHLRLPFRFQSRTSSPLRQYRISNFFHAIVTSVLATDHELCELLRVGPPGLLVELVPAMAKPSPKDEELTALSFATAMEFARVVAPLVRTWML
jgi:hypothetical protein